MNQEVILSWQKKLNSAQKPRAALEAGVNKLADTVRVTLGPKEET